MRHSPFYFYNFSNCFLLGYNRHQLSLISIPENNVTHIKLSHFMHFMGKQKTTVGQKPTQRVCAMGIPTCLVDNQDLKQIRAIKRRFIRVYFVFSYARSTFNLTIRDVHTFNIYKTLSAYREKPDNNSPLVSNYQHVYLTL